MMVKSYKGYEGVVTFVDTDANLITGEIVNIQNCVNFQARTPTELQQAFQESVDEHLAFCADHGLDPDRPFSGQLNVRLGPELHKAAHIAARMTGQSLNAWLKDAITRETSSLPNIARESGAFGQEGPAPKAIVGNIARKQPKRRTATAGIDDGPENYPIQARG